MEGVLPVTVAVGVTGEDARAVLEIIFAAYESAGTGRKVTLPFKTDAAKPIDLWNQNP